MMWDDEIGSLEVGKKADLIVVDTRHLEWHYPGRDIARSIVYSGARGDVESVMIDGQWVMRERKNSDDRRRRSGTPHAESRRGLEARRIGRHNGRISSSWMRKTTTKTSTKTNNSGRQLNRDGHRDLACPRRRRPSLQPETDRRRLRHHGQQSAWLSREFPARRHGDAEWRTSKYGFGRDALLIGLSALQQLDIMDASKSDLMALRDGYHHTSPLGMGQIRRPDRRTLARRRSADADGSTHRRRTFRIVVHRRPRLSRLPRT